MHERENVTSLFARDLGVFLLGQDGHFVAVNAAAEKKSGYSAQELKEMTYRELFAPDQLEGSADAFQAGLRGETYDLETAMISKDGRRVELHLVWGPITIDGSIDGLFLIAGDFIYRKGVEDDLRKEREELKAALRMAEYREREKLAHVLHDGLQQTLVSMKFQLANMERGLSTLRASAEEIRELIDDSIETARSFVAELSPPILRHGLVPALEWLAGWMRQKLGFTVNLSVSEIPPAPEELTSFLFQAIRELLFNAAKHANVGSARVHVAVEDRELQVAVEDEGTGFEPDQAGTESGEGFGLVSIRERISLLGGRFEVRSAPGEGSRFRLTMPFPTEQV
jgi:PAS domain S-box-containing protein